MHAHSVGLFTTDCVKLRGCSFNYIRAQDCVDPLHLNCYVLESQCLSKQEVAATFWKKCGSLIRCCF